MPVVPQSKLPPDSQPWARYVDDSVSSLDRSVQKVSLDTNASLKSVNGALKRLGQQVQDLTELVEEQAALQAQILATQAQQAVQLAQINALAANQVDGSTGTNSASVTLTTAATGYAPISFVVPSGYTRAKIMGVSAMYMGGTVASILRTQIAGVNGPDMYAFTNAAYANATAVNAASLTGLTPGSTITVRAVANTTVSSTTGVINTAATVTWLK